MTTKGARNDTEGATNIENCRAVDLGLVTYGECLRLGPNECPYAMPFGYAFLCQHPRLIEIMEQTNSRGHGYFLGVADPKNQTRRANTASKQP